MSNRSHDLALPLADGWGLEVSKQYADGFGQEPHTTIGVTRQVEGPLYNETRRIVTEFRHPTEAEWQQHRAAVLNFLDAIFVP